MRISVVSGGFDPIHSGHINYISAAKKMGDLLIVMLNRDEWLKDKKGKPFMPFSERKQILENIKDVAFWLGTERGCSRYHVDNVPKRLLVTYAGRGTEWIPDIAADRTAFESGEPNEHIVKDKSALRHVRLSLIHI